MTPLVSFIVYQWKEKIQNFWLQFFVHLLGTKFHKVHQGMAFSYNCKILGFYHQSRGPQPRLELGCGRVRMQLHLHKWLVSKRAVPFVQAAGACSHHLCKGSCMHAHSSLMREELRTHMPHLLLLWPNSLLSGPESQKGWRPLHQRMKSLSGMLFNG